MPIVQAFMVVAVRGWENKNGQLSIDSLDVEIEGSHEQKVSLSPSITRSSCAGIARGRPLRPSSPIVRILRLYYCLLLVSVQVLFGNLIYGGDAPRIDELHMRVGCHKRSVSIAQRSLLGDVVLWECRRNRREQEIHEPPAS